MFATRRITLPPFAPCPWRIGTVSRFQRNVTLLHRSKTIHFANHAAQKLSRYLSAEFGHSSGIGAIRKGKTELEQNGKSFSGKEKDWLGGLDSNQDSQIQSLESYRLDDLPAVANTGLTL